MCIPPREISSIQVEWSEDEKDTLETGVICFGTNWRKILGKYRRYFDTNKTIEEMRKQYYVGIEDKDLVEADVKHGIVVNRYGKPIYRNNEITYFFCVDPLVALRKIVDGDREGYRDGEDVFVGTYFNSAGKIHRFSVSEANGVLGIRPISTTTNIKNRALVFHEWKHAVMSHVMRHPSDFTVDDTLGQREAQLSVGHFPGH